MAAGRPSDLTDETQRKICEALANGSVREHAARNAGISPPTFYAWLKKGRESEEGKYHEFLNAVRLAEAKVACENVAIVQKAAKERDEVTIKKTVMPDGTIKEETTVKRVFDWQAAKWWLECRFPEHFGVNRKEVQELKDKIKELESKGVTGSEMPEVAAVLLTAPAQGMTIPVSDTPMSVPQS